MDRLMEWKIAQMHRRRQRRIGWYLIGVLLATSVPISIGVISYAWRWAVASILN